MFDFESGEVILIDKPLDWTSFDTVNFIRSLLNRCYGIRKLKVGHAGTLDPLATGLLIICTGKMTKQIDTYQAQVKIYTGTILLGQTTPTFDLESEPNAFFPTDGITPEQIETYLKNMLNCRRTTKKTGRAIPAEVFRHQNQGKTRLRLRPLRRGNRTESPRHPHRRLQNQPRPLPRTRLRGHLQQRHLHPQPRQRLRQGFGQRCLPNLATPHPHR